MADTFLEKFTKCAKDYGLFFLTVDWICVGIVYHVTSWKKEIIRKYRRAIKPQSYSLDKLSIVQRYAHMSKDNTQESCWSWQPRDNELLIKDLHFYLLLLLNVMSSLSNHYYIITVLFITSKSFLAQITYCVLKVYMAAMLDGRNKRMSLLCESLWKVSFFSLFLSSGIHQTF